MFITITSSKVPPELSEKVESFLQKFLPRMKQQPGVRSVFHYARPDRGDESTIVIWDDQKSIKAYRESELIKEAIVFEQKLNLPSTREIYPLILSLDDTGNKF